MTPREAQFMNELIANIEAADRGEGAPLAGLSRDERRRLLFGE